MLTSVPNHACWCQTSRGTSLCAISRVTLTQASWSVKNRILEVKDVWTSREALKLFFSAATVPQINETRWILGLVHGIILISGPVFAGTFQVPIFQNSRNPYSKQKFIRRMQTVILWFPPPMPSNPEVWILIDGTWDPDRQCGSGCKLTQKHHQSC